MARDDEVGEGVPGGAVDGVVDGGECLPYWLPQARRHDEPRDPQFGGEHLRRRADGHALAHFIIAGHLATHLARVARTYEARRRALIAGLRRAAPALRVTGVEAGLHFVATLPPGTDEMAVQRHLGRAGLAVDVLGQYATTVLARPGLVCSYALLPETQAQAAAAVLAAHAGLAGGPRPG